MFLAPEHLAYTPTLLDPCSVLSYVLNSQVFTANVADVLEARKEFPGHLLGALTTRRIRGFAHSSPPVC